MDKLTSIGIKGHVTLLTRGLKTLSWKNADLHLDMKVSESERAHLLVTS